MWNAFLCIWLCERLLLAGPWWCPPIYVSSVVHGCYSAKATQSFEFWIWISRFSSWHVKYLWVHLIYSYIHIFMKWNLAWKILRNAAKVNILKHTKLLNVCVYNGTTKIKKICLNATSFGEFYGSENTLETIWWKFLKWILWKNVWKIRKKLHWLGLVVGGSDTLRLVLFDQKSEYLYALRLITFEMILLRLLCV